MSTLHSLHMLQNWWWENLIKNSTFCFSRNRKMSNITVISTLPTTATESVVSVATAALTSYLNESSPHSESLLATALSVVSSHASKKPLEFYPNNSYKHHYKAHHHHTSMKYEFTPVTLNSSWSRLSRLLILSCLSVIGSVGNVFMISSLLIEEYLKRAGEFVLLVFLEWVFFFIE